MPKNTITPFIPVLVKAMDNVSRELVGAIPAVTRDMNAEAAAIGQEIRIPITPSAETEDVVAASNVPEAAGEVITPRILKITKAKRAKPIVWTGNEQLSIGGVINNVMLQQTEQRMRALVNEVERDLCNEIAACAIGAGSSVTPTTGKPFDSDLKMLTEARKKLLDNGAPMGELQCVLNTADGMALRNQNQLQRVNEAGEQTLLRQGLLGTLMGFELRESAGYGTHTAGAGSGYKTNGDAKAGATKLTLDSGTGALKAGDFIKFGSDDTQYVLAKDFAGTAGDIELVSPLQKDVSDKSTVTCYDNYTFSAAFDRSSVWLATRTIPVPQGGDKAIDRYVVTDTRSGLAMTAALYPGYLQNQIDISLAWGVGVIRPEHTVAIVG